MLTHPAWGDIPGLHHGFLDRVESTRAAPGDWTPALRAAGIALPIATVRQVHGTRVVTADSAVAATEADGVAAAARGLAVGIVTADCVPALMIAPRARVAAAVHAGWRGASAGVLEEALSHLRARFDVEPSAVEVVLGPAIGPCCYRVGPEVQAAFTDRTATVTADAWTPAGDRLLLDLRLAEQRMLEAAGVAAVTLVGPCTACTPTLASYRRDGHPAGRQLSFVGWE